MQCVGWRQCLFAFLLAASLADASSDLNDGGPSADSKSGYLTDADIDNSNESRAEDGDAETFAESLANYGIDGYPDNDQKRRKNIFQPEDWMDENNPIYNIENPDEALFLGPSVHLPENELPVPQVDVNEVGPTQFYSHSDDNLMGKQNWVDELKNDPIYKIKNAEDPKYRISEHSAYPPGYIFPGDDEHATEPTHHDRSQEFISKLVPFEEQIMLHQIPGAENIIKCTKEGEIHNFWAPDLQCMVCVCLAAYGRLSPVCVSCQSCMTAPAPTTHRPTLPPHTPPLTPPPSPEHVSCKPLPVNVPFPSPIDPCKVCVCTETLNQWGKVDVIIKCQHNPQCVLPTTPRPPVSTPVPLPVCEKFPSNVPFPHPHDPCKICQCIVTRTQSGETERQIVCYTSPECQPTTSTEPPSPDFTELPPPEICDRYSENVLFPHPRDQCQVCKCTVHSGLILDRRKITCYVTPNCSPTPEPKSTTTPAPWTPPPVPDNVSCAPLPTDTPFQSPINPCQICTCTETADIFGRLRVDINCQENPQCILPPDFTTISPDITNHTVVPACKNFPTNVYFPHPSDACKLCKCNIVQRGPYNPPEQHMSCILKPECSLTPRPPPTTTTESEPEIVSCAPLPVGKPFQSPVNPCHICLCTEQVDLFGRHDVKIECKENPECIVPPYEPTIPSIIVKPIRWAACKNFPLHVSFPHPHDPCQRCKCSVQKDRYGIPGDYIGCSFIPECVLPSTTEYPVPNDVCGKYPINTPFDDPNDQCRTCTCTLHLHIGSAGPGAHQNSLYPPKYQILCQIKPECMPPPTTERPSPYEICGRYPINTPFEDPNDQCRSCRCTHKLPGSAGTDAHQNSLYPPQLQILCQIKPECLPTEEPEPNSFCQNYPVDVPFTDPRDPCRSCVCYNPAGVFPSGTHTDTLGNALPVILFRCSLKPECHLPTSEPITTSPTEVSCKPLPSGIPFQSPLNPCQICICTETVDVYGRFDVVFKCQMNPQCVVPTDVTTVPPDSQTSPVPLPACAQFPTNVVFPHPRDPCKLCKCTVQRTQWGNPDQHINCFTNPDCGLEPTTIEPPEPSMCDYQPPNVPFVLPTDPCQICRCILERTIYGEVKKLICGVNPACSDTRTTPAPWPPAPPGPLPGPAPHESCAPYIPNQPFQHPWDECQVCVCKEAISSERITIEVNCYTKPSCCYEPPFEIPGLPGPGIPGSRSPDGGGIDVDSRLVDRGSTSWTNPGSGSNNQVYNWKHTNENGIGTAGGNLIGGNAIYSSGGNLLGPSDLYRPGGVQNYNPNLIDPSDIRDENWIGNQGPVSGNTIGPSGGNMFGSVNENWIKSTGSNVIGPGGGNMIRPTIGNLNRPAGGNSIGTNGGHLFGTNSENLYGYSGENLVGSNIQPFLNPNGNIYIPNRGNTIFRPTKDESGQGLWKKTYHYNLRPEEAEATASSDDLNSNPVPFRVVKQHYSNKMRTKSGRPSDDDDSAEYDEST